MEKTYQSSIGVFVVMLLLLFSVSCKTEQTVNRIASPDGRYVASLSIERIWKDYDSRVTLEATSGGGVSLIAAQARIAVSLSWLDSQTLLVEYDDYKVYHLGPEAWQDLRIVYRKLGPTVPNK